MHLVDSLIHVPMTAKPSFIVHGILDPVEPPFCAIIYCTLVNSGQENFGRLVLEGAGMGQNDIHRMRGQLLRHIGFDFLGRLFVGPPTIVTAKTVELIYTIGATNHEVPKPFQREDLSVLCKQQVWILLLIPYETTVPFLGQIGIEDGRISWLP